MGITDQLRAAIAQSGKTHYAIGKATGLDTRGLDRFVAGETTGTGRTIDLLCDYFGMTLTSPKKNRAPSTQRGKKKSKATSKRLRKKR